MRLAAEQARKEAAEHREKLKDAKRRLKDNETASITEIARKKNRAELEKQVCVCVCAHASAQTLSFSVVVLTLTPMRCDSSS